MTDLGVKLKLMPPLVCSILESVAVGVVIVCSEDGFPPPSDGLGARGGLGFVAGLTVAGGGGLDGMLLLPRAGGVCESDTSFTADLTVAAAGDGMLLLLRAGGVCESAPSCVCTSFKSFGEEILVFLPDRAG